MGGTLPSTDKFNKAIYTHCRRTVIDSIAPHEAISICFSNTAKAQWKPGWTLVLAMTILPKYLE